MITPTDRHEVSTSFSPEPLLNVISTSKAAAEIYSEAIDKLNGDPRLSLCRSCLESIRDNHRAIIQTLEGFLPSNCDKSEEDKWDDLSVSLRAAANLTGPDSTKEILRDAEERCLASYLDFMSRPDCPDELREYFQDSLIPAIGIRIREIDVACKGCL